MSHLFHNPTFIVPASLTKQAGGTATGSITDVQTFNDGNVYQVVEAGATPGFEIDFDFTGISRIWGLVSMVRYDGSTGGPNHDVTMRLHDYTAPADLEIIRIGNTGGIYQYRTILLPSDVDFTDGSGNAQVIIYHNSGGSVTHDIYIDYIALLGVKL